jgi:hypothetical protein
MDEHFADLFARYSQLGSVPALQPALPAMQLDALSEVALG